MCRLTPTKLTQRVCIIELEAAENLVDVSSMKETIPSNNHLETLCKNSTNTTNRNDFNKFTKGKNLFIPTTFNY